MERPPNEPPVTPAADVRTPAPQPAETRPGATEEQPPAVPPATTEEYRCDLCGAPMLEWHCRIICTFCGYQRDCSDP
jgi:hypothetical protein